MAGRPAPDFDRLIAGLSRELERRGLPYMLIARAVTVSVGGVDVKYASAEDLILHKLFAGRPRDIEDAKGVVARQGARLDWRYIEGWAQEFSSVEGRENLPAQVGELRAEGGGP